MSAIVVLYRSVRSEAVRGFTLVELLVVMSLLSLLALALGSTFRGVAMTEARVDQRIEEGNDFRVVSHFLKVVLGRVVDRSVARLASVGAEDAQFFVGDSDRVTWLGIMPARYGGAGLHFFRLQTQSNGDRFDLVLKYVPDQGQKAWPEWGDAQTRVLLTDLTEFVVGYEDLRHAPHQWQPKWTSSDRLPDRLQIVVLTRSGRSKVLVLSVRALLGPSDDGGFGVGGNQ